MSGERGFTIVETLVALAILAVMLVSLYAAIGLSFRTFDKAATIEEAVLVAQSQLDAIVAQKAIPSILQGRVEGTRFEWRLDLLAMRPAVRGMRTADIRLSITGAGLSRGVTIDRLLLLQADVP